MKRIGMMTLAGACGLCACSTTTSTEPTGTPEATGSGSGTGSGAGGATTSTGRALSGQLVLAAFPYAQPEIAAIDASGHAVTSAVGAAGAFALDLSPGGTYQLAVELPGFKKLINNGVNLEVAARVALNLQLEVGGAEVLHPRMGSGDGLDGRLRPEVGGHVGPGGRLGGGRGRARRGELRQCRACDRERAEETPNRP